MVNLRTLNLAFQFVDLITGGLHRHRPLGKVKRAGVRNLRNVFRYFDGSEKKLVKLISVQRFVKRASELHRSTTKCRKRQNNRPDANNPLEFSINVSEIR